MAGVSPGSHTYFNHSYYCLPGNASDILARTDYGIRFCKRRAPEEPVWRAVSP
jgi:imidazoleglycerol phosphate synthase glutamine amidotransferase subunit HisH